MGETLKIDVSEVLKAKMPGKYRYIPRFVVKWLERIIHQDELNALLLKNGDKKGVDFADVVLKDLEITTEVIGKNNLPPDGSGRYIYLPQTILLAALTAFLSLPYWDAITIAT